MIKWLYKDIEGINSEIEWALPFFWLQQALRISLYKSICIAPKSKKIGYK